MTLTTQEIKGADAQAMQAVRAALAAAPKLAFEPGARESYDQIIGQGPPPKHVRFEQAEEDIARFLAEHVGTQAEARA